MRAVNNETLNNTSPASEVEAKDFLTSPSEDKREFISNALETYQASQVE